MNRIITTVIEANRGLFSDQSVVRRVEVGFTNTVYDVDGRLIVKICTDPHNEANFLNELNFYQLNQDNPAIPKLYRASQDKHKIPYFYAIIEKVPGQSLYEVWHQLTEERREMMIEQLCLILKELHRNAGEAYDWSQKNKKEFMIAYRQVKRRGLFSASERATIESAYTKFDQYLQSNDFVMVHNDLHFDNILLCRDQLKLIDFERSMYAPRDFELGILYRMIRKPWKFASAATEKLVDKRDYARIKTYLEKYYDELLAVPCLDQRLAIYDLNYFLSQLADSSKTIELKEDVLAAANRLLLKRD